MCSVLGYVSEFSPDGKLFALLDSDGKLKIWDVKDNQLTQEYVPDLHLSVPYTCFVWFASASSKVSEPNGLLIHTRTNVTPNWMLFLLGPQ